MTDTTGAEAYLANKRALIWVAAIMGFLVLTWCTMLYNDYNRVIRQYVKPAFCINFDTAYQEYRGLQWWWMDESGNFLEPELWARKISDRYIIDYGYFQGLGYSVELSGAFLPFEEHLPKMERAQRHDKTGDLLTPWPGVLQARFYLFGKEIARINRDYPPDAGRTDDWRLREIF